MGSGLFLSRPPCPVSKAGDDDPFPGAVAAVALTPPPPRPPPSSPQVSPTDCRACLGLTEGQGVRGPRTPILGGWAWSLTPWSSLDSMESRRPCTPTALRPHPQRFHGCPQQRRAPAALLHPPSHFLWGQLWKGGVTETRGVSTPRDRQSHATSEGAGGLGVTPRHRGGGSWGPRGGTPSGTLESICLAVKPRLYINS